MEIFTISAMHSYSKTKQKQEDSKQVCVDRTMLAVSRMGVNTLKQACVDRTVS